MPFPILTTDRLLLRCIELNDAAAIQKLRSNESVNQFLDRPKSTTIEEAQQFIKNILFGNENQNSFYWVIVLKETNTLMGTICYWNLVREANQAELGFELLPQFQGKGIMSEALLKVLEYGWNKLQFETINAFTRFDNQKSISLLEKFNFQHITNARESQYECYALKKQAQ